jgi:hypothetical protein
VSRHKALAQNIIHFVQERHNNASNRLLVCSQFPIDISFTLRYYNINRARSNFLLGRDNRDTSLTSKRAGDKVDRGPAIKQNAGVCPCCMICKHYLQSRIRLRFACRQYRVLDNGTHLEQLHSHCIQVADTEHNVFP